MVKADVKTPKKRKSLESDSPAKKQKLENGKNNEKTPQKPFTPKKLQTPKNNQQLSAQKSNKKNKVSPADSGSPGTKKPFTGTKKVFNKQQNKQKQPKGEGDDKSAEKKKRRKNQYSNLITQVKTQAGSKDPELLSKLDEKIKAIKTKPELSKTAKRKLAVLQKLKIICEEGAEAAAAKSKAQAEKAQAAKGKTEKKTAPQKGAEGKKKKAAVKAAPVKAQDDDEDSDEKEESDAEESGEEEEDEDDSGEEEEDSDVEAAEQNQDDEDDDDDDDEEDDDDDDEDDDSEEEAPAPKEKLPAKKAKILTDSSPKSQSQNKKQINLEELKTSDLVTKGQKRFVLFVGNIPYDTTREDLLSHFNKAGEILHVRLPTVKGSQKPRGFGYIEVKDEVTYQKCLSMHHTQIKGRRINVLYTQGGKKKGDQQKKEIKLKNMKLHGLRNQGKLAGSVKQSQKRSFRRNKSKEAQKKKED